MKAEDFFKHVYSESDEAATISGTGAKRQTKSGSTKTAVNTNPQMKDAKAMTVDKGTKGFDRNNRPNDHRSSVDFPRPQPISPTNPQPISPTNPQPPRNPGLRDMWVKADLERSTREAQRRQSQNYGNRKS